jgi:hypothetical protein
VQLLHRLAKIHASFDDPNLVSRAGLVPVMALAQRAGLAGLAGEHVRIAWPCGVNPQVKVPCLAAGMIGGADSIDDLALLRHGAMPVLFGGVRAPSMLGSFLGSFTWGNVLQLGKVNRLLPGRDGQLQRWVSDAEVAETEYTAFTSKKRKAITARLIVRRVKTSTARPRPARANCLTCGATTPSSPTPRS